MQECRGSIDDTRNEIEVSSGQEGLNMVIRKVMQVITNAKTLAQSRIASIEHEYEHGNTYKSVYLDLLSNAYARLGAIEEIERKIMQEFPMFRHNRTNE